MRHLFAPAVSDEALGAMVSQAEAAPPVAVLPPDETVREYPRVPESTREYPRVPESTREYPDCWTGRGLLDGLLARLV